MPNTWTKKHDRQLRALHAQDLSVRAIATKMGFCKTTVARKAKDLGLQWDRAQTAAATKATVTEAKARRAKLAIALLEDAERLRTQLFAETTVFNFGGRDNTYNEHVLNKPPFADQLKITQAVGALIDRHLKLDLHDADTGIGEVVSMLSNLFTAMGVPQDGQPE